MLSVLQMRTSLRLATGEDSVDLPDADANLYLNKAFWEILEKHPFKEQEKTVTFATIIGTALYTVPADTLYLRQLSLEDPTNLIHIPLLQSTVLEYETNFVNLSTRYAQPTVYIPEGTSIRLYPTPDKVYNLVLKYYYNIADLSDTSQPTIPQAWHEIIELGAKWRRFMDLGDYQRASMVRKFNMEQLDRLVPVEAKELKDAKFAALSVPRQDNY